MFDWIVAVLDRAGYLGIAALMFLENVFPPIPSELIMPLVGFAVARGEQSLLLSIAAGTLGSVAGATLWYWIGRKLGRKRIERLAARHGRWLTLCPPDVARASAWFERHGGAAVIVGRMVPTVRSLISVPAGIEHMPVVPLLFYSCVGTAVWTTALAGAGYFLEDEYGRISAYLNPASTLVIAALALWYVYRVVTFERHKSA
jgi:membrane protein DedA with SNARE-associated domain